MTNVLQAHRERVGRRIRLARQTARLTHDQLGAKVGTSRQHLIKLEKGLHLPRPEMLAKIAEATGKTEAWLSGEDDDEEADPMASIFDLDKLDAFLTRRARAAIDSALTKSNDPAAHLTASTAGSSTNGG